MIAFGRDICGELGAAERREWLCVNGIGGFASGTVAGSLTRRYHGLLVAALDPPLGRTMMAVKCEDTAEYGGGAYALSVNRWADGTVAPAGHVLLERFALEGTTPVWTYAVGDARLDKRIWMEPGANTTYVRYTVTRASAEMALEVRVLVDYRDYHGVTRGGDWRLGVTRVPHGVRVLAFEGARPLLVLVDAGRATEAHHWYRGFALPGEAERGLEAVEDHLHAATVQTTLAPGDSVTLVVSAETAPSLDTDAAWRRRRAHEAEILEAWRRARPGAEAAPTWIQHLVLAADQFVVRRATSLDPDGLSIIAGYHWFGDWGRDTMIALPGLALATGRPEVARRVLATYAGFLDRGMLPNRFPDAGQPPEYNTVDATLWYVQAIRAYHAATEDDGLLKDVLPGLEDVVRWHRAGTRHGIAVDPADGLLASGEPGVQLTWMDAKVGDWVVTPRMGKAVEVNALWYNALRAIAGFARRLGRPAREWDAEAERVRAGFTRFWNERARCCYDVIDAPAGDDDTIRPNQLFAVALPDSPLPAERARAVVDACARHLLTSSGLRTLPAWHPQYQGRYGGDPGARDGAYHQGTVWPWLLGPFALAHHRVYRDARLARSFLEPLADHLVDHGLGSIAEICDGDPPFAPRGCIAQAWSVAETLRAWQELSR